MDKYGKSNAPAKHEVKINFNLQITSQLDSLQEVPEMFDEHIKVLQSKVQHLKNLQEKQRLLNTLKTMEKEKQQFQPKLRVKDQKDLTTWKYSDLRDVINTSYDLELLEACKHEFHRRLKIYHAWKAKNRPRTMMEEERAPRTVLEAAPQFLTTPQKLVLLGSVRQRYFKVPFQKASSGSSSNAGWWYVHFDGPYVARQMDLYPRTKPRLLVAGHHDIQMCELSLEETGLTRKPGAEILENDFNKEWEKHGGQPYVRPTDRK